MELSIAKRIAEANKEGICTRGFGTFGCACPKCFQLINELAKTIFRPQGDE